MWVRSAVSAIVALLFLVLAAPAMAVTYVVTNTNDSGVGSLRQAMLNANASAGPDVIHFNIPGSGPHTITPLFTGLPIIVESVTIDGYTQPGASANTNPPTLGSNAVIKIQINANNGPSTYGGGIEITGGANTIRGLSIYNGAVGIFLRSNGNVIEGNFLGLTAAGSLPLPDVNQFGVYVDGNNNVVGGTSRAARNVIAGNDQYGIWIHGTDSNVIRGNLIGTDPTGMQSVSPPFPSGHYDAGIFVDRGTNTLVGGSTPAARNVISGNQGEGIFIIGIGDFATAGNEVYGNYIGLTVDGSAVLPNGRNGIRIEQSSENTIGGTGVGQANVISGNLANGIRVGFNGARANGISGNYIGSDLTGIFALGSQVRGVFVSGSWDCVVESNFIVGNFYGIVFDGFATDNFVFGNWIRINTLAGIVCNSSGNTIGGLFPGDTNEIVYNGGPGILVAPGSGTATQNVISRNSIHSNSGLGIDLSAAGLSTPDGVTPNDPLDADAGGNDLLNFPVISSIVSTIDSTRVGISYSGMQNELFTIQIYSSLTLDASGHGEGQFFHGSGTLLTNGSGLATKTITVPGVIPPGRFVTATAHHENASEFSAGVEVTNTPVGQNVQVSLQSGFVQATLTFDNVTSAGATTLAIISECPELPGTFLAPEGLCYDISTTATFSGNVEVCLSYLEGSIVGMEENVRLIHYDETLMPPDWVDITTSVDTEANRVYGQSTTLSPFVVGTGSATAVESDPLPERIALHQNVPNPFNPNTVIAYDIPVGGADVTIVVYDVGGRQVQTLVDEYRPAGRNKVQWNGRNTSGSSVATGVYFYRMQANDFVQTRKMVLLK